MRYSMRASRAQARRLTNNTGKYKQQAMTPGSLRQNGVNDIYGTAKAMHPYQSSFKCAQSATH